MRSNIILPSPRKHNEFSYENGIVTYWYDGCLAAQFRIDADIFEEYLDGWTQEKKDQIWYQMKMFYEYRILDNGTSL